MPLLMLAVSSACAGAGHAQIPRITSPLAGTPLRYGTQPIHPPSSGTGPTPPVESAIAPTPAMRPVPGPPSNVGARWLEIEHGEGWVVYVDAGSTSGEYQARTVRVASAHMSGSRVVLDVTLNVVDCSTRTRVSLAGEGGSRRSVIPRSGPGAATMDFVCEDGDARLTDRRRRAGSDLTSDAASAIAEGR